LKKPNKLLMPKGYAKQIGVEDGDRVNMKIIRIKYHNVVRFERNPNGDEVIEIIKGGDKQ